jgi:hypothetical protein
MKNEKKIELLTGTHANRNNDAIFVNYMKEKFSKYEGNSQSKVPYVIPAERIPAYRWQA